jgi:hypothetical protein
MAMVASHKRLFTHYQIDGVDNHTYHYEFLAHVQAMKMYGGLSAIGVVPTFLDAMLKEMEKPGDIANAKNPTNAKCAQAIKAVRDEYFGALMLSGSNHNKYGPLQGDLKTNLVLGRIATPSW